MTAKIFMGQNNVLWMAVNEEALKYNRGRMEETWLIPSGTKWLRSRVSSKRRGLCEGSCRVCFWKRKCRPGLWP